MANCVDSRRDAIRPVRQFHLARQSPIFIEKRAYLMPREPLAHGELRSKNYYGIY